LIVAGQVTVNGVIVTNPNSMVPIDAAVAVADDRVLRGTTRLRMALDRFGADVSGRLSWMWAQPGKDSPLSCWSEAPPLPAPGITNRALCERADHAGQPGRPARAGQTNGAGWRPGGGAGQAGCVVVPAPAQYADDSNLRARQRLWRHQRPEFDLPGWIVDLAEPSPGMKVLDLGCGNGAYLERLTAEDAWPVGVDISAGMLASAGRYPLVNADATCLPFADRSFGVVLAAHMLYHVAGLAAAISEMRRVLAPGGICLAVTNGEAHIASLRQLVEQAVARSTPGWKMRDPATVAFSLGNGAVPLQACFDTVDCVRPPVEPLVLIDNAAVVAGYVASVADHYQPQVDRPWDDVVEECRRAAQAVIDHDGAFVTSGEVGAFVCR
jgi:SAM-dependent methyltransferase